LILIALTQPANGWVERRYFKAHSRGYGPSPLIVQALPKLAVTV
jgi:hypothetical protein